MPTDSHSLAQLETFVDQALPAAMRRMFSWNGLHPTRHAEVLEDLHQDLLLDCVENADTIAALDQRERHGRWFRLIEHSHYRLRVRDTRRNLGAQPLAEVVAEAPPRELRRLLPPDDWQLAEQLSAATERMRNGRVNTSATAANLGVHPREVRALWEGIAESLGFDDDFLAFWRTRLVEALVGLAADLLRDHALVRVHDEDARVRPDPNGRLRRIRQIKKQVSVRPLPRELRRVLVQFTSRGIRQRIEPQEALSAARELAPGCSAVHLWSFETAIVRGEWLEAARALRAARAAHADPVRVVLARARLLEATGREAKAIAVIQRARRRHRGDLRLTRALGELAEPTALAS